MSIKQLNPPIPLMTPLGKGQAHLVLDYSTEHNLTWVVFLDDSGKVFAFDNTEVRAQRNITIGRNNPEIPKRGFIYDLITGKLDK